MARSQAGLAREKDAYCRHRPAVERSSRRRVLILTQDLARAGAQRQAVELAAGLKRRGHDARVGVIHPGGPLTSELQQVGVPVVEFARRWRWDLSPIPSLVRYLRLHRIQVIHSLLFLPNFYARFAGRLARTPAIVSSLRSVSVEGCARLALDVATCMLCHANVANCEAGRRHYLRRCGSRHRTIVIRNGLRYPHVNADSPTVRQLEATWRLRRFAHTVGMVARMDRLKKQDMVLAALRCVLKAKPAVGAVFLGDGPTRARLQRIAAKAGLAPNVVFAGASPNPWDAYRLFDVYAHASVVEGVSNSILEAMASGLPVVANNVGGNSEVVIHGKTGYVVGSHDASGMAAAILRLIENRGLRLAMGAAAAERARTEFSIDRLVTETEYLYNRLLSSGPWCGPP